MNIGYIGLGKMGLGMAKLMTKKGHTVVAYNRSDEGKEAGRAEGLNVVNGIEEMIQALPERKIVWIMVSHQGVDAVLDQVLPLLKEGDMVIDGGNSKYTETVRRAKEITVKGIRFVDAGVSGGPSGARNGACIMVGGEKKDFDELEGLLKDITVPNGYGYMGDHGAGHFVKMVHNGIEYGMMQAIGEGFEVMKKSPFNINLSNVVDVYQHGSVIESRLVGWLGSAYKKHTEELNSISGTVSHSGEGLWTVEAAKEMNVPVRVIEDSLQFRIDSQEKPSYTGKVVSALRNEFGGHDVSDTK